MLFSLRSRFLAVFSVLLIIPFVALAYILSEEATKIIKASIETSAAQTMDQFASNVSTVLAQIEDTGNQIISSRVTQDWLAVHLNADSTMEDRILTKQRLREYYSSYAINNSNGISLSAFVHDSGGLWTQDRSYVDADWYQKFAKQSKRWTSAHKDQDQSDEIMRSRFVNSYIFPLVQLQSLTNVGFIKINYPTDLFRTAIEKIRFGQTGKVFLLTREGDSVLNQDISAYSEILRSGLDQLDASFGKEASGVFPIQQHGVTHLLFFRKLPAQDWTIIGTVPEQELYLKIKHIRQTMLLVTGALLVLAMVAAFWLSAGITKPLSAMARAMRHVKRGEFGQALQFMPKVRKGHSEVNYVTDVFEQMTIQLRYLIETEFETNLRRKNAEYKALLLQINPHFYNNTLEIISGLAAMNRGDLVMDATESLGKMMRYSLNLNTDLVRVAEEINYTRDYLFILKLRHEDRLSITIEEDPATRELLIAKFILQPLIENAVKYSMEKAGEAKVTLQTLIEGDRLLLAVKDNGIGMTPELMNDLLSEVKGDDSVAVLSSEGHSIGLRNVISRCRLNYGDQFQLELYSLLGQGTEIILRLPLIRS